MANKEKLIELIKKLRVMADKGGTPNERASAELKLRNLCLKYRINNVEELFYPKPRKKRTFKLHSFICEKDLLIHCIIDSVPQAEITGNEGLRQIQVKLTDSEYQEIQAKFSHYWNLYEKEREALLSAFIIKNDIGIIESNKDDEIERDIEAVIEYMNIVKASKFKQKQLI